MPEIAENESAELKEKNNNTQDNEKPLLKSYTAISQCYDERKSYLLAISKSQREIALLNYEDEKLSVHKSLNLKKELYTVLLTNLTNTKELALTVVYSKKKVYENEYYKSFSSEGTDLFTSDSVPLYLYNPGISTNCLFYVSNEKFYLFYFDNNGQKINEEVGTAAFSPDYSYFVDFNGDGFPEIVLQYTESNKTVLELKRLNGLSLKSLETINIDKKAGPITFSDLKKNGTNDAIFYSNNKVFVLSRSKPTQNQLSSSDYLTVVYDYNDKKARIRSTAKGFYSNKNIALVVTEYQEQTMIMVPVTESAKESTDMKIHALSLDQDGVLNKEFKLSLGNNTENIVLVTKTDNTDVLFFNRDNEIYVGRFNENAQSDSIGVVTAKNGVSRGLISLNNVVPGVGYKVMMGKRHRFSTQFYNADLSLGVGYTRFMLEGSAAEQPMKVFMPDGKMNKIEMKFIPNSLTVINYPDLTMDKILAPPMYVLPMVLTLLLTLFGLLASILALKIYHRKRENDSEQRNLRSLVMNM